MQTKAGAIKQAETIRRKYGDNYWAEIGRKGGSVCVPKGFSKDTRNVLEKLFRKPKRARWAGSKGGSISKRRKQFYDEDGQPLLDSPHINDSPSKKTKFVDKPF